MHSLLFVVGLLSVVSTATQMVMTLNFMHSLLFVVGGPSLWTQNHDSLPGLASVELEKL